MTLRSWSIWRGERWIAAQCRRGISCIYSPEAVVRTSIQHRVGGYSADLPHTADLEMWLRIASVADVARVNGPDQALRRLHDASMMVTRFHRAADDLVERQKAYERFFAGPGRHLETAGRCLAIARRRLALDALGAACAMHRAGHAEPEIDELVGLARQIAGPIGRLHASKELHRLRLGRRSTWDSLALHLYTKIRDIDDRIRWRRWHYIGL